MATRRAFLTVLGTGAVVAAAGAFGLQSCDRMPEEAVAGWKGPAADVRDPRVRALSYALLAPNPHNLQSWLADLSVPDTITLFVDRTRLLPMTDPFGRQIVIGQGTFLELLVIAAAEQGFAAEVTPFPDGVFDAAAIGPQPVARVVFRADPQAPRDPLFAHVLTRRSTKTPYGPEPISASGVDALRAAHRDPAIALGFAVSGPLLAELQQIAKAAVLVETETPRTHKESVDVVRVGADEILRHRDGIDLHGPMFWWMKTLGLMTPQAAMTPGTLAYQGGLDYAMGWADATPSFGWLVTPDNARASQLAAGRAYVRLNLAATGAGVAMHPVSQALQEYPEMAAHYARIHALLAPQGGTVQMLFRLGVAPAAEPSPRRPVTDLIA